MASFSFAASFFSAQFETKSREDGSIFCALKDDSPDWMKTAAIIAHDGEFSNDSRYELICDAVSNIAESNHDSADDARQSLYDDALKLLPCQTGRLLRWFAAHPARLGHCDDALEEGRSFESVYDLLSIGFCKAAEETLSVLITEIEEQSSSVFNPDTDCQLLLSDTHGQYIPQLYCCDLTEDDASEMGIEWSDVTACQAGPEFEWYWEAWQSILDNAVITDDNGEWRLEQNGDLWMIRADVELPEDWFF